MWNDNVHSENFTQFIRLNNRNNINIEGEYFEIANFLGISI